MRFYYDDHGKYRGFSTGPLFWIAVAVIALVVILAFGYQVLILAPFLAVIGLAIWAWTWQIRKWREAKAPPHSHSES